MERSQLLLLHPQDNVAIALSRLEVHKETTVAISGREYQVVLLEEIPPLHKVAISEVSEGGEILKYGYAIGRAKQRIQPGMLVHAHNLEDEYGPL